MPLWARIQADMSWLVDLLLRDSTAHTMLILALVIVIGMAIGRIRVRGIGFGIAGVLFAGILLANFRPLLNEPVIDFVKDFGLVLFVFMVGLQVGPGFFASFRRQGLQINLLAAAIVAGGVLVAVLFHFLFSLDVATTVGLLAGAVTNTPSLGAAQQALRDAAPAAASGQLPLTGLGYAVAYPFGVIGVILAMVLLRHLFRVRINDEAEGFRREQAAIFPPPETLNLEVQNPQLSGQPLKILADVVGPDIVISRVLRRKQLFTPGNDTVLQRGDVLLAVGARAKLKKLRLLVGKESRVDLKKYPSQLTVTRIVVTRKEVLGKSLAELQLRRRYGVNITRINRAGVEFVPSPGVHLQFGDRLNVVGAEDMARQLANLLGNSLRHLEFPNILPIFLGILAGVVLGSLPIAIPGLPFPLKLGSAGGPLIVAILLGRFGNIGRFTAYISTGANLMLREIGIALFLACVGLRAGAEFVPVLVRGRGLTWLGLGAVITLVPVLLGALAGRLLLKKNYLVLCGLMAGSMTDPPALAFANGYVNSDAPALTYATVYPLVTFLRILSAQLLVLFFIR